ncbi:uncharacterized protein BDR25DRAFT_312922 [Lindgomyces ingoldianus]|uniref:Uncharacterized protein n=1 Tax=Lindgomyces ingoldianus TaxID=673940 RepID=A0ACB6R210_9PLEO|nr:uncharacterized protein BDR25DRAFT_312922 [Lindgomyces ingoldianus]KAF2472370.1 hypothetical protein BDR25DRAFT_312922 [Lindgomyces ingoldianus]
MAQGDYGSDFPLKSPNLSYWPATSADLDLIASLQSMDGSTMDTCGIVSDAEWTFGEHHEAPEQSPERQQSLQKINQDAGGRDFGSDSTSSDTYICDFHVVEHLTVPVILSSDPLFGTNAFKACVAYFYES